ncbi:MAG TPA: GTPase [Polyangia bacterium]
MSKSQPSPPQILSANFLTEVRPGLAIPPLGAPEIAIAGRSNVGKSTLLNRMAARNSLARTSKTPGRTRGIMFYELAVRWAETPAAGKPADAAGKPAGETRLRLVDLPGYGYAQVSHDERRSWQPLIEGYVESRSTLALFVTLVDARREVEAEEIQMIEWLETLNIPHRLVVTKVDKLNTGERGAVDAKMRRSLPPGAPPPLLLSGQTGDGVDRLWHLIARSLASGAPETG